MVALNGLVAGFSNFAERTLDKLAPNLLFVSSTGVQGCNIKILMIHVSNPECGVSIRAMNYFDNNTLFCLRQSV